MTGAFLALALLAAAPAKGASRPAAIATPEPISPETYLAAITVLTMQREIDDALAMLDRGRKKYPEAQGFHLRRAEIHLARGERAEAYYEYQWEILRGGFGPEGVGASSAIATLLKDDDSGETLEIRRVALAAVSLTQEPALALKELESIEATRGDRFVLRLFVAEAKNLTGDHAGAEKIYRDLLIKDPWFVPAYVELGGVLSLQGKTADAQKLTEKARAIDPAHPSLVPRR